MVKANLRILRSGLVLSVSVLALSAWSTPVLTVDSAEYDMGIIEEGTKDAVEHAFVIKNTGNEKLVIKDVRPG
jgi:hypothetical protein